MAKEPRNQQNRPDGNQEEGSSALRDALLSKVKSEGKGPADAAATPPPPKGIGAVPPEMDSKLSQPLSFGNPSDLDRAAFCRQFATLIEVGIPILKALQMMTRRTHQARLRRAIAAAAKGVEEGQSLHQAMAPHSHVFSPMAVNIIRVGEVGGILESSLVRLADIMESKVRIKRKVLAACMYPIVALLVAISVISIIMTKAIPTFVEVYSQAGKEEDLPQATRLMIGLSEFMVATWPFLLGLAVLIIAGLILWGRTPMGARVYSWLAIKVPIIAGVNRKIAVARSSRTLGSLLTAGIPLIDAISITADTNENVLVCDSLKTVHDEVEKGERMTDPLTRANIFPPLVTDMIGIGEETGTLDTMLIKVADIYDEEVDVTLNGFSSIIEPLLIVVLGGVVIFIAVSVLLPYFRMAQVVG
ncbi:MAG: type II secretion system F family protein [bacterium]|nr:type II secretion system F family protein [bacterium]